MAVTLIVQSFIAPASVKAADAWTQWRGPEQNGVATGDSYPSSWAIDSGIAWKSPVSGSGGSTPVVSDSLAFLTAGNQNKNTLVAYRLADGSKQWTLEVGDDRGGKHKKGSGSNPSPVIDGEHVYAYFRSGDLACAQPQWRSRLADQSSRAIRRRYTLVGPRLLTNGNS